MDSMVSNIKLVLSDVDGVLTDGSMYYTERGDELKRFHTYDGMGFQMLQAAGIATGIVTSETTEMVNRRAAKLGITYVYQGRRDGGKLQAALDICNQLGITLQEVAYIGDDINCFELLSHVGWAFCPANARPEIKAIPRIRLLSTAGGSGAFREMSDWILAEIKKETA